MDERSYPLALTDTNDPRFTFGFVCDVADVLARHGFPSIGNSPQDHVELQLALYRFIYVGDTRTERLAS
ncbi:hypothetical protein V1227_33020 [Lentzea sp. DG1S-22]|uniref:hypothetical protein n=1 Tax=Lentzea sp. DG1S-22 TaxID=3108822 RepID=UPI002E76A54F|nr:hypothetical protein [Lentzea sp. DG1S-22]WVH79803.1 hypothetical protein V1227_33020 [Lentzea sp. DG1S-22]